jgi:hypothetical protein
MSSPDFSQVLAFTYGTTSLSLESYSVKETPAVKDFLGKLVTRVTVNAECIFTSSASPSTAIYATTLASILADLKKSGRPLVISGLGQVTEYQLLPVNCEEGGPHIEFTMKDAEVPLGKRFSITITATVCTLPGATIDTWKTTYTIRPDNLATILRTGEVHGYDAPDYFFNATLANLRIAYPPARWVTDFRYELAQDEPRASGVDLNIQQNRLDYTVTIRQNFGLLPHTLTGKDVAVDGEIRTSTVRDEQYRKLTTTSFDLLVTGDPSKIATLLRPTKLLVTHETMELTTIREQRMRGSFTTLESADSMPLLNWTETVRLIPPEKWYEVKTYPGAEPVLVAVAKGVLKMTQTGSCRAAGQYKKAPHPIFHTHLEPPEISYTDVTDVEKQTDWNYVMYPSQPLAPTQDTLTNTDGPDSVYSITDFLPNDLVRNQVNNEYFAVPRKKPATGVT